MTLTALKLVDGSTLCAERELPMVLTLVSAGNAFVRNSRDLAVFLASASVSPVAPERPTSSDPARSTIDSRRNGPQALSWRSSRLGSKRPPAASKPYSAPSS